MLTIVARYKAKPGNSDEVASTLATHAAFSREEPGCLDFIAYRCRDDARHKRAGFLRRGSFRPRNGLVARFGWQLADLPSYEHDRQENRQRVVVLDKIRSAERTELLLLRYLDGFRSRSLGM
ncbi:MAG TPA: antibiotic biosynthesis monooxygenase family protein [Acidimicrobiales bacterium]|nr:antibiotic biosynthesis monooxygenase family protein [Acidimicrobiales bacterium]